MMMKNNNSPTCSLSLCPLDIIPDLKTRELMTDKTSSCVYACVYVYVYVYNK